MRTAWNENPQGAHTLQAQITHIKAKIYKYFILSVKNLFY